MSQPPETKMSRQQMFSDVRLYVILSSGMTNKPVLEILQEVMLGGADAVQLREKAMPDSEFLALAKEFRKITSQANTLFIVNDRAEIAKETDADGLHIGQSDISISTARSIIGYDKILGVSTHNILQARKAQKEGADYLGVGPLFHTATKDYEPTAGINYLQEVRREITIPFVAIGGINAGNLHEVLSAGGLRVAVCSAIICSNHIQQATRALKSQIISHAL